MVRPGRVAVWRAPVGAGLSSRSADEDAEARRVCGGRWARHWLGCVPAPPGTARFLPPTPGRGGGNCHLGPVALVTRFFRSFILYFCIHVFIYVKASCGWGKGLHPWLWLCGVGGGRWLWKGSWVSAGLTLPSLPWMSVPTSRVGGGTGERAPSCPSSDSQWSRGPQDLLPAGHWAMQPSLHLPSVVAHAHVAVPLSWPACAGVAQNSVCDRPSPWCTGLLASIHCVPGPGAGWAVTGPEGVPDRLCSPLCPGHPKTAWRALGGCGMASTLPCGRAAQESRKVVFPHLPWADSPQNALERWQSDSPTLHVRSGPVARTHEGGGSTGVVCLRWVAGGGCALPSVCVPVLSCSRGAMVRVSAWGAAGEEAQPHLPLSSPLWGTHAGDRHPHRHPSTPAQDLTPDSLVLRVSPQRADG